MCYSNLGKFTEALPWFERSVKAQQKGDIYGKVDQVSLQTSLDAVSACLRELDRS